MIKQMFFSKKSAYAALVGLAISAVGTVVCGTMSNALRPFDYFDIAVRLLLSFFLFYGGMKHKLLAMQAGACGLLLALTYFQASFVLNNLFGQSVEDFIILGFWGSFYLASELMILVYDVILTLNHFFLFVLKKTSFLRVAVSQAMIILLFVFLLFQLFIISRVSAEPVRLLLGVFVNIGTFSEFLLIAHTQLILALDEDEGGNGQ